MPRRSPIIATLLLCGCTTVSDFQKMSAHERAVAVCDRQKVIRDIADQISSLQSRIRDSQMALARGYRVHQQCFKVEVYGNASVKCNRFGSQVICEESRPKSYETRCTETPVSINPELERQNIRDLSQSVESLDAQMKEKYRNCYQFIYPLTPEQAYKYY
jgi:hypothetical protein